ncbi:3D domain-containing protein [Desulforamulus aquiferis]|uniref:3D domain-containing protein n=1 Tax=Desulforamulus aquiferis TaxID=1397668 RepID=A0AAW7ZHF8_9FIRM|nr:3D domain-containing protein [Desulforamulus aquiferis]MDO7789137.1 3D domain-containing protein [Desulforamulus aquiferis]
MIRLTLALVIILCCITYTQGQPIYIEQGPRPPVREVSQGQSMQVFVATAYCHTGNQTKTWTWPEVGRTLAVDPSVIPLGSKVYIEGIGWRVAEDTGGLIKGNIIDLYMASEAEALQWGRREVRVYLE